MKMKEGFRKILTRRGNGISIIRPLYLLAEQNSEDDGETENLKITGEDPTEQGSTYPRQQKTTENCRKITNDSSAVILDNKKPEFYLMNLPLTDSLIAISNEKISFAILNAGKAYSERMNDQVKATETFESLLNRFPESELVPETLFLLYKINKDENNAKSEAFRQRLLQKYPESEFARILSDPEYYEKIVAEQKMAESLYMEAYDEFLKEKYDSSVSICDDGLNRYPKNNLAPKFMLLKAYCIAKISDERAFKEALTFGY